MAISVFDIPITPAGYDITNKYFMVHDLTVPEATSTKLINAKNIGDRTLQEVTNKGATTDKTITAGGLRLPSLLGAVSKVLMIDAAGNVFATEIALTGIIRSNANTISIPNGLLIDKILVKPSSNEVAKIGLSNGGDEVMIEDSLPANAWKVISVGIVTDGGGITLYLSGFSGAKQTLIYTRTL